MFHGIIEFFSKKAELIPKTEMMCDDIEFAEARDMSVVIPGNSKAKADNFIDDICNIALDEDDNLDRIIKAPVTIIEAMSNPTNNRLEKIQRDDMVSLEKTLAEGAASEKKICLGWNLDTRTLIVSLPRHKHKAWGDQIRKTLQSKLVSNDTLMSIIGRLENIAQFQSIPGHFFSNIRHAQILADRRKHNIKLSRRVKEDLKLAINFLDKAEQGFSMNTVVFRKPEKYFICDASEYGLGGFSTEGRAWTWEIPQEFKGRAHINVLEYMAQLISIWTDMMEGNIGKQDCILAMGDNTSAMGWLKRSNFRQLDDEDESWLVKQCIGRKLAELILNSETVLYKQWLQGSQNALADSLSRDFYFLDTHSHELFLHNTVPSQIPPNFHIKHIPKEINLFAISMLQKLPKTKQWLKPLKPSELAVSNTGKLTSTALESMKSFWKDSPDSTKISLCQDSPKQSGKVLSLKEITKSWWNQQSQPLSHMWHRPSGQTTGQTQDWTAMERQAIIYQNSSRDIKTKMQGKRSKKPYPCMY